ncbi:MAG: cobalamin biosynthesis protein [Candidatus Bathyarchaeia archaeon]|nr:cobalamin biosynthesis protein [Candidatus Bathyarchaeota archaeon]
MATTIFHIDPISQILMLTIALIFDLLFGEPPETIHPTVIVGGIIERFDRLLRKVETCKKIIGFLLTSTTLILAAYLSFTILETLRSVLGQAGYLIVGGFILKTTFAVKSMELHVNPIMEALEAGEIQAARRALSKIVRRNTEQLDERLCSSATIESIAESTVDGIISPIFYYMLLGVPGAVTFRVINTLDSIVGYKDEEHIELGWFPAKIDTVANYLPARLTGLIMVLTSAILGFDWRNCFKTLLSEHGKTESLNAGWPMSAMAGSLKVQLWKIGSYKLAEEFGLPNRTDIGSAIKVMKVTTIIFITGAFMKLILISFLMRGEI